MFSSGTVEYNRITRENGGFWSSSTYALSLKQKAITAYYVNKYSLTWRILSFKSVFSPLYEPVVPS